MMGRMGQSAGQGGRGRMGMGNAPSQPQDGQSVAGQGHGGHGPGPAAMDPEMQAHRDTVHALLSSNTKIKRYVELLPNGIKATTESDDLPTAALIKKHVPQMYKFLETDKNARKWDPLFVEIFKHADKIKMTIEPTEKGVRVTETSEDAYAAKLIQEHSKVIDNFVAGGWTAAHKEHPVPAKSAGK